MKCLFFSLVVLFLTLASCRSRPHSPASAEGVPVIDIEAAMEDLQPALKLSDFGAGVRYIPLETHDSCLVSLGNVQVFDSNIVVSSRQLVVFNFDKGTGRFMTQLGHRGEDPEGYWDLRPIIMRATACSILRDYPTSCRNMMPKGGTGGKL